MLSFDLVSTPDRKIDSEQMGPCSQAFHATHRAMDTGARQCLVTELGSKHSIEVNRLLQNMQTENILNFPNNTLLLKTVDPDLQQ